MPMLTKLFHIQPFRSIYVFYRAGIVLIKLPIWTLLYFGGLKRPRPSWTLKKTLLVNALADVIEMPMTTGDFLARDHTKEVTTKHYACGAESQRVPAYGFGNWGTTLDVPLANDGERIILNLHGGGFNAGTAHMIIQKILQPIFHEVYSIRRFRRFTNLISRLPYLGLSPISCDSPLPNCTHRCPRWICLLTRGLSFKPQNVIVCGDSAGGNLGLALVRYLRDTPRLGLGVPGGLILISPWADLVATAVRAPENQVARNQKTDYIQPSTQYRASVYAYISYLGGLTVGDTRKNVYLSPASFELDPSVIPDLFNGFPRTYIVGGDAEILMDSLRLLHRRMVADMGEEAVVYDEVVDATHDFLAFPLWEPERSSTFKKLIE